MAKILISFLGTGPTPKDGPAIREYRKAKYSIGGTLAGESSFVSSVLMDYYEFDSLFLIGTCKSMWEEVYRYYSEKNQHDFDEDKYFHLAEIIGNANNLTDVNTIDLSPVKIVLGKRSEAICIPYGLTQQEQTAIFNQLGQLLSKLDSGDEIALDITHSFRSLPLFATAVINYFHSLSDKQIVFKNVYYGMLDVIREFDGIAPIVDISTTVELQKWTTAAFAFKEYGKGALLADLLGGDEGKIIRIFSDAVNINYLNEIKQKLVNFQTLANKDFENDFAQWVVPEVLKSFTKRLQNAGQNQYLFQYELSLWHREKQNYASAYIVFTESIITYVCEKNDWNWLQMDNREKAKKAINEKNLLGLSKIYQKANKPRNNIAHNLNQRTNQVQNDIKALEKLQKEFFEKIKEQRT